MIYKAKKGATAAAANSWVRIDPGAASVTTGGNGTLLDDPKVTVTDDGSETTINWLAFNYSAKARSLTLFATWIIDTGYTWSQVLSVDTHIEMSTIPSGIAMEPVWGIEVLNGTSTTDAAAAAANVTMSDESSLAHSARLNNQTAAWTKPGADYTDQEGSFRVVKAGSNYSVRRAASYPFDPAADVFFNGFPNSTTYDAGRLAAGSDSFYIALVVGNDHTEDRSASATVTAVGAFWYSINIAGHKG